MAKQTTYSAIMAKMGERARKAWEAHKHDEVDLGNMGDLPAGINNGVAQLVECKLGLVEDGKQNAGQPFFYAAGVVVTPKTFTHPDGTVEPLEGRRTSVLEMLCDTPNSAGRRKTQDEHLAWMMNELKKLGADVQGASFNDIPSIMETLKEVQPFFRFRTWKGTVQKTGPYAGKDPKTQHTWNGQCEYEGGGSPSDAVIDETDTAEDDGADSDAHVEPPPPSRMVRNVPGGPASGAANGTPAAPQRRPAPAARQPAPHPAPAGRPGRPAKPTPPPADDTDDAEFDEFAPGGESLTDLAAKADGGDEAAQDALTTRAEAAGLTTDDVTGADSWGAVAEMIEEAEGNAGGAPGGKGLPQKGAEEEEAKWEPSVGDVYLYRPVDPKTKRPAAKAIEIEIVKVDKATSSCDARNLDDRKTLYRGVPWEKLEGE